MSKAWMAFLFLVAAGVGGLLVHNSVYAVQQQPQEPPFAKNLQVLKFVKSKAELKGWMKMIKNSLGVDCDYCHNTDDFASDEKPEKRKARMMLKMLVQIRQDYFAYPNAKEPTCYTCHRGQKEPVNSPEN